MGQGMFKEFANSLRIPNQEHQGCGMAIQYSVSQSVNKHLLSAF